MKGTAKKIKSAPMPREERYLSQRAVKAAELVFGAVVIRKKKAQPADK